MWPFRPPGPARFARNLIRQLQAAGVAEQVVFDPGEFTVRFGETTAHLGNLYDEFCHLARRDRKSLLARYVRGLTTAHSIPDELEQARGALLPHVRTRFFHEALRLRAAQKKHRAIDVPCRLLAPDWTVEVVYDTPEFISSIDRDRLERWSLDLEAALALAKENMWPLCNHRFEKLAPGLHLSNAQDTHDASRLFMYDLIWQLEVAGPHVVLAPNRDFLIVSGAGESEGLVRAAALCERIFEQQPRPLDGRALVLDDRTTPPVWRPFLPPPDHPAFPAMHKLALISRARDYNEQKELLDALQAEDEADVHVASFTVVQDTRTGGFSSYAVWVEDVDAWLPAAEKLVLMRQTGGEPEMLGAVDWRRTVQLLGERLPPHPEWYPVRRRASFFPDAAALEALDLDPDWA